MTQIIKILGTGCASCKTLTELTKEVVAENNIDATVEKVEDMMRIMEYNVMSTPALVCNDKVLFKGRVPSKKELLKILQAETSDSNNSGGGCC